MSVRMCWNSSSSAVHVSVNESYCLLKPVHFMSALSKVMQIHRNCKYFVVNINDFEQFTSGRVRLLLVIPSRIFFYSKYIAR